MYKFEVICGSVIVTDPCYGVQKEGFCQNIVKNVMNGNWNQDESLVDEGILLVLHDDYNEEDLNWQGADYPCGVDSGALGVYDLDKYNGAKEEPIGYGITLSMGGDGFNFIEVGLNDEQKICGIRHEKGDDIDGFICDNCDDVIEEYFYTCTKCNEHEYDLCKKCYENVKELHDNDHEFSRYDI